MKSNEGKWFIRKGNNGSKVNKLLFLTKNEKGEYRIPRITIELGKNFVNCGFERGVSALDKIYDIYGSGPNGNIEEDMIPALAKMLNSLDGKVIKFYHEEWMRSLTYIVNLTRIKNKIITNEELSEKELRLLYGCSLIQEKLKNDKAVLGYRYVAFGTKPDYRIEEMLEMRDQQADFDRLSISAKEILLKRKDYTYNVVTDNEDLIIKTQGLKYACDSLLKNKTFIKKYIINTNMNVEISKYTANNINDDKELGMLILKNKISNNFKYLSDNLRMDPEIILLGFQLDINNINYVEKSVLEKHPDLIEFYNEKLASMDERKKGKVRTKRRTN